MRVWSVVNQKGGVGKTTTAVSVAGILAQQNKRVLMVDLDPHGSMTSYFGLDPDNIETGSHELFYLTEASTIDDVKKRIKATAYDNLDLIPASTLLATIERKLQAADGLGLKISRALAQVWDDYDIAILDSPPVLGVLMINALAACESVLIPVQTEHLALKGLERMEHTLNMINRSRKNKLNYLVVPTMYDRRTQASQSSLRFIRNHYEKAWPAMIPIDTRFRDASKAGKPISFFDSKCRGSLAYQSLVKYMLKAPVVAADQSR